MNASITRTVLFVLVLATGCAPAGNRADTASAPTESPAPTSTDRTAPNDEATNTSIAEAPAPPREDEDGQDPGTRLEVSPPAEEPAVPGFDVVAPGNGEPTSPGDIVLLSWEMVAFDTGQVVESTATDFGGPIPIEVGGGEVPAVLDEAITGQPIGTRLDVRFPAGMSDLPEYFDPASAYVLAVELVEKLDIDQQTAPPETSTPTTASSPSTTVPVQELGLLVSTNGPLTATPPADAPLPRTSSFDVVTAGSGPVALEGDVVAIAYLIVSWTTGEVVKSATEETGGPETIVLGELDVPRYLESAVFRQPAGTRLQVVYEPGLPDLPEGLSQTDGYLLAVDIIGIN